MIFKYLPDAKIRWRDVWVGAAITALLFGLGKWALGLYLGSGSAASAYGAASSLITLLLWIYYSSQILLLSAGFTQVYADYFGARVLPDAHTRREGRAPGDGETGDLIEIAADLRDSACQRDMPV